MKRVLIVVAAVALLVMLALASPVAMWRTGEVRQPDLSWSCRSTTACRFTEGAAPPLSSAWRRVVASVLAPDPLLRWFDRRPTLLVTQADGEPAASSPTTEVKYCDVVDVPVDELFRLVVV